VFAGRPGESVGLQRPVGGAGVSAGVVEARDLGILV